MPPRPLDVLLSVDYVPLDTPDQWARWWTAIFAIAEMVSEYQAGAGEGCEEPHAARSCTNTGSYATLSED